MEVTHPEIQTMADALQEFAVQWLKNLAGRKRMVIVGQTGCGKTRAAKAIYRWCRNQACEAFDSRRGDTIPAVGLMEWSRAVRLPEPEWAGRISEAAASSITVIDDLGAEVDEFKSGLPIARACEILNGLDGRFSLITTNVPPEQWADRWDARVSDRLLRDANVMVLSVPSFAEHDI